VDVDVPFDFTSAAAVRDNVWAAVTAGVHTVVGSSGLTAGQYAELDRLARDNGVIAAGNLSVQAAVLQRAAKMAAEHLDRWMVIDYSSAKKADVPSGTARQLAEAVGQVRVPTPPVPLSDLRGPVETRGADVAGTRVHSVRLPSFVVSTEIVFGGTGERLVIRHDAGETAGPYVAGTLLAIRRVAEAPGCTAGPGHTAVRLSAPAALLAVQQHRQRHEQMSFGSGGAPPFCQTCLSRFLGRHGRR
jgi:4-hydroxy-tetrahydrodipicolinate reductase